MDYDDPEIEERWCEERRRDVADYLQLQGVRHGAIGEWPAWHVAPYVSIWAIESASNPGWVGFWVICGDLPTDYVSSQALKHPRDVMRAFADRWSKVAENMAKGQPSPDVNIGSPSDWPTLGPMLASRAATLRRWADDAAMWEDL